MTNQEISQLVALFDRSTALTMRLRQGDFSLELDRSGSAAPGAQVPSCAEEAAQSAEPAGEYIRAPLVGTYYAAPGPEQAPFIRPGDRVSGGQTVCLIEAMKMMSEVTAPFDCVIEETLQKDGALLSFDAPIVRYRRV